MDATRRSPTKEPRSPVFPKVLQTMAGSEPLTHAKRWTRKPSPADGPSSSRDAPTSSNRVAHLVQSYEGSSSDQLTPTKLHSGAPRGPTRPVSVNIAQPTQAPSTSTTSPQADSPRIKAGAFHDLYRSCSRPDAPTWLDSTEALVVPASTGPSASIEHRDAPLPVSIALQSPASALSEHSWLSGSGLYNPQLSFGESTAQTTASSVRSPPPQPACLERDFEALLDKMQLPSDSVRRSMLTLSSSIKRDMLKSASTEAKLASSSAPSSRPSSRAGNDRHRKTRSLFISSTSGGGEVDEPPTPRKRAASPGLPFMRRTRSSTPLKDENNNDAERPPLSRSRPRARSTSSLFRAFKASSSRPDPVEDRPPSPQEDSAWWAVKVRCTGVRGLDPAELVRLRSRLRSETPAWVGDFNRYGGLTGLYDRLREELSMEWREEQHDDHVLYELLRCLKALAQSTLGKKALGEHAPAPFVDLARLLFSDKRPGDLPARQLLVEMIAALYDILPEKAGALTDEAWEGDWVVLRGEPSTDIVAAGNDNLQDSADRRYVRKVKDNDSLLDSTGELVASLMTGPPNAKEKEKVDFMKRVTRPRRYKAWVREMSDIGRDYFWIFCHTTNPIWPLEHIDVNTVETPKVPSGMTGGVEAEAMEYATAHLKLVNAIARNVPSSEAAFAFHMALFESGFERVIMTLRRASLAYYQLLHLEIARYVSLARSVRFNLGPHILQHIDENVLSRQERWVLEEERRRRAAQPQPGVPALGRMAFES